MGNCKIAYTLTDDLLQRLDEILYRAAFRDGEASLPKSVFGDLH